MVDCLVYGVLMIVSDLGVLVELFCFVVVYVLVDVDVVLLVGVMGVLLRDGSCWRVLHYVVRVEVVVGMFDAVVVCFLIVLFGFGC